MDELGFGRRLRKIKNAIFTKPSSLFIFVIVFVGYIALNVWLNELYVSFPSLILHYSLNFSIPFVLFNFILIPFLVGTVVNLMIIKLKDLKEVSKKDGSVTLLGLFSGLLGGACAGCFAGLFPAFFGLFGITATLNILPFKGLELQALSVVLLIVSVYYLTNDTVCKTDLKLDLKNDVKKKNRK